MNKNFQIALILSATDRMTSVINKAFGNANKSLTGFHKQMAGIGQAAAGVSIASGATAAAVLTPIGAMVDKAIQFEDKMADVAKVLNMKNGSAELEAMGKTIRNTSVYLAKMPTDVAELYANLAQGGVAQKNLDEIAKKAGSVAVAFDIDAGLAGDRYVKTQNALNTSLGETSKVFDSINSLSDKTAAKASQILDYLSAGGASVARTLGITGQESSALGSVFISMGKSGEEAATIFERMTKGMMNMDKTAGKVYAGAGGGLDGIMAVIEKGRKLTGTARFEYFKAFGEYGTDVSQLANNFEMLQKHLGYVANEQDYLGSVNKEFQNRMATTGTKLRQAKAELQSLAIEAGTGLLPAVRELIAAVAPMLTQLSQWIAKNPKLTAQILKGAVAFGIFNAGLSVISGGISAAVTIIPALVRGMGLLRTALLFTRGAILAVTTAAMANPIIAIVTGIAIVAGLLIANWSKVSAFFKNAFYIWGLGFERMWNGAKEFVGKMYDVGKNIFIQMGKGMLNTILYPVKLAAQAAEKIRGLFPSSPAKYGPLRDLHKTDIFGQVARGINPAPLQMALTGGINAAVNTNAGPTPIANSYSSQGGTSNVTFAPVINMSSTGAGTREDIIAALKQYEGDFLRFLQNANRKQMRAAY
jgi:TP901 family phage tail tape measure protein